MSATLAADAVPIESNSATHVGHEPITPCLAPDITIDGISVFRGILIGGLFSAGFWTGIAAVVLSLV